ncbi:MAG: TrkH family potassium uptake protein, partial [Clostridia bacterium]|nr:TrkH family potassium uptake protein [Clostridia bacterium]
MNYQMIRYTLGWVLNIESLCMLLPLVCSLIYNDGCTLVFSACILLCFIIGTLLVCFRPKNKAVYAKEGFIIVALSWII